MGNHQQAPVDISLQSGYNESNNISLGEEVKRNMAQNVVPAGPEVTENDKLMAALGYLFTPLVPIIILLIEDMKNRAYPRYHALQSLGFFVAAWIAYEVVAFIVFTICSLVTLGFGAFCLWVIFFLPLIPQLYYTYVAYTGKYFDIPVITNFMVQQKWLVRP